MLFPFCYSLFVLFVYVYLFCLLLFVFFFLFKIFPHYTEHYFVNLAYYLRITTFFLRLRIFALRAVYQTVIHAFINIQISAAFHSTVTNIQFSIPANRHAVTPSRNPFPPSTFRNDIEIPTILPEYSNE